MSSGKASELAKLSVLLSSENKADPRAETLGLECSKVCVELSTVTGCTFIALVLGIIRMQTATVHTWIWAATAHYLASFGALDTAYRGRSLLCFREAMPGLQRRMT